MNSTQWNWATFSVGMTFGVLSVLAVQRVLIESPEAPQFHRTPAIQIVDAYNRGIEDALKTNPASWRLEETCLEIWANKQPSQ